MKLLLTLFILYLLKEGVAGGSHNIHKTKRRSKVINTDVTKIEKYPFIVNLMRRDVNDTTEHICGGSIISSYWVVTTARCICGVKTGSLEWWVLPGVKDWYAELPTGKMHPATKAFTHEEFFGGSSRFDIALITVENEFEFDRVIQPITIAGPNFPYKPGGQCMAAGYGITKSDSYSTHIKELKMTIVADTQCRSEWRGKPEQVCAEYFSREDKVYKGDFGGPLVQFVDGRFILIGIATVGTENTTDSHISQLFIRIGFRRVTQWIRQFDTGATFYNGN